MPLQEVHTGFTFGFDGSKLAAIQRGVGRASTNLNTIAAKTEMFAQKMGGFIQQAKQVVGVYLGFRAVRSITTDYATAADEIAKYSAGLGLNAQAYQRLTHAAQLNGLTIAELNVALPNLAKNAGEAADGSKSMQLAFRRAGVSVKDGVEKLKDPITILTEMADGLDVIKDKGRKTQILMNLFGRSGKKMGVLLAQGSEGIKKAMMEADKLGLVLSDKQLKAGEKFTDEMLRVKAILTGLRNTIASKLLPSLSAALEKFRTWWTEGRNAERALRALKLVAIFTGIVIARLIGAGVLRNLKLFVQGIWAGVQALRALGLAGGLAAIKIWAIVAAFALVALIVEDLISFAQGKDSVIGRLLGDSKLAKELKKSLLDMAAEFKKAWKDAAPALAAAWTQIRIAVADLWREIRPLIGPAFRGGVEALIISLEVITTLVSGITNVVKAMSQAWAASNAEINRWDLAVNAAAKSASKALTGAWASALGGLKSALDAITSAAMTAYRAVAAALGLNDIGSAISIGASKAAAALTASRPSAAVAGGSGAGARTSTGDPILPGLFQPFGGAIGGPFQSSPTAGPGIFAPQPVTTNVAAGAVQVSVSGGGDPKQIAKAINEALPRAFSRMITQTSRDLVRPPTGQR